MPAISKMGLPLAKAKPISNSVSGSVVRHLRRGKTCSGMAVKREE